MFSIVVPRARDHAEAMGRSIESRGHRALFVPTIAFIPPSDPQQLHQALRSHYDWVVFTSVTAVNACDTVPEGAKIAAVGHATAAALRVRGYTIDLIPEDTAFHAAGLVAAFPAAPDTRPAKVLLPRSDIATDVLPAGLCTLGWDVDEIVAYRTVPAQPPEPELAQALRNGTIDAICFTSGSTVRNFITLVGMPHPSTVIACIGPRTREVACELGLDVRVMPERADVDMLVEATLNYLTTLHNPTQQP
ncbi:MAG: uroporphyrinogen-III synthase [Corynebacterium sp.]|nr:uroporphyrinogen-III synthase [Corynebacterium sp.]